MRTFSAAISRAPWRFPSRTYKAENGSVYMKNYHQKRSPTVLLGQPVSYYDILAFIYFIYSPRLLPPVLRSQTEAKAQRKPLEMIIQKRFESSSLARCARRCHFFRGPFRRHKRTTLQRNDFNISLFLLRHIFRRSFIIQLLLFRSVRAGCPCSHPSLESIKLFLPSRVFIAFARFFSFRRRKVFLAVNLNKIREMAEERKRDARWKLHWRNALWTQAECCSMTTKRAVTTSFPPAPHRFANCCVLFLTSKHRLSRLYSK